MATERGKYKELVARAEALAAQVQELLEGKKRLSEELERTRLLAQQRMEEVERLQAESKHLKQRVEELEQQLREARRSVAPFHRRESQRKPEGEKKRPGRRAGHEGHYRQPTQQVDETHEVLLPCCPHCQGRLDLRPWSQIGGGMLLSLPGATGRRDIV